MVDISKFKDLYVLETEEQLQTLNDGVLALEKNIKNNEVDHDLLNDLMRASHTVKGSSATMGFSKMAYLTHVMEDVFDYARNDQLVLNEEIIGHVFVALDSLEESLVSVKENDIEINLDEVASKIKNATGVDTNGTGKSERTDGDKPAIVKNATTEKKVVKKNNNKKPKQKDLASEKKVVKKIEYIKVPVERLDTLMDLVEELVIDRMRLKKIAEDIDEIKDISEHIELVAHNIQNSVMQARLVPVDQVFSRFPRMVRDLAVKQKKDINFELIGADLELDRSVVDKLGEPLVHLLRNAVDHGIVKSGDIKLKAARVSEYALITVENTGTGIDPEQVKESAIERQIISPSEAERMNKDEIINLIFHPELSTNKKVTEISGRGVGLSVVKSFVETLGGQIKVKNLDDKIEFLLELPLTLAIINSLLVTVGGEEYAIPFSSIDRSVIVNKKDIRKMADKNVAIVNGVEIPLLKLAEVFKLKESSHEACTIVICKKGNQLVGVVVDKLINEQEITVKPLSPILRKLKIFSGSTILGSGRAVLILDVINLLKKENN